ncbi:MAG: hypothetical protein A3K68_03850 [Euryarchaeota archaeon RBG_16_68_13]|nr:MAG: hypothetical protein A3K68_03850 [Euryarchaeota archaeon RBG_16_68_13]
MIRFYTREFFEELTRRLNEDGPWKRSVAEVRLRFVCSAADKRASFLLEIDRGRIRASEAKPDTPADYRFEGAYDAWMRLCKGEYEFDRAIETGKIRVAGLLPPLMGPLNHIVVTARSFPKEF